MILACWLSRVRILVWLNTHFAFPIHSNTQTMGCHLRGGYLMSLIFYTIGINLTASFMNNLYCSYKHFVNSVTNRLPFIINMIINFTPICSSLSNLFIASRSIHLMKEIERHEYCGLAGAVSSKEIWIHAILYVYTRDFVVQGCNIVDDTKICHSIISYQMYRIILILNQYNVLYIFSIPAV